MGRTKLQAQSRVGMGTVQQTGQGTPRELVFILGVYPNAVYQWA